VSFLNLQVNGDAALQNGVIEDKADVEVFAVAEGREKRSHSQDLAIQHGIVAQWTIGFSRMDGALVIVTQRISFSSVIEHA
jgi:hypothetical protein